MDRFGFIHDKLDIKILILYILNRLPSEVMPDVLTELVFCDEGINYFDYADCLAELEDTGHIQQKNGAYLITEKGARNGSTIESSIPYSVRARAERALAPVAAKMRRSAMIYTGHEDTKSGCVTSLSLSDGVGDIISMNILCSGEEQALIIEKKFRQDAEGIYNNIISMLSEEEKKE